MMKPWPWTRRGRGRGRCLAPMRYTDQRTADLTTVRRDRAAAQRSLEAEDAHWASVKARDDPESFQVRAQGAPRLLALRAEVQRLADAIAALEDAITSTATQVAEYAQVTTTEAAWVEAVLDRLPTDDELRHAFATSRQIETTAATLLRDSGDRGFRRPRVDPHRQLREALEDRLRVLTSHHLLRSMRDTREKESA